MCLENTSGIPYEGDIKLVLEDKNGNKKQDIILIDKSGKNNYSKHVSIEKDGGEFTAFECELVNGCRPYGASFGWSEDSIRAYSIWEILDESGTVVYTYRNDNRANRLFGPYYKFTTPGNYTVNVSVYDALDGGKQIDFISTFIKVE